MQKSITYTILLLSFLALFSCKDTKQEQKSEYTPLTSKEVQESLDDENIDPEYKAQLENLVAMMNEHPKSARLFAERANIFVLMKKTMQALQDITMAVDLEPDNAEYRINKSQLLRQFKRNKEALVEIEEALKLDPESVGAHFNRGALFFNINYFEKALSDFTFCIDKRPEVGPPYFNRAFTYEQLHDIDAAKADLNKFLEISDNEEWKKMALGKIEEWNTIDFKTVIKDKDRLEAMGMKEETVK